MALNAVVKVLGISDISTSSLKSVIFIHDRLGGAKSNWALDAG